MYTRDELKDIINRAIQNMDFDDETPVLYEPVRYLLTSNGKRIRPVMTLMACNLFTDKVENAIIPAIGLEVFHNFTLMHDDIMDNAAVRRGNQTVHVKWDMNQAILSGDVMAFTANDCIAQAPPETLRKVIHLFNDVAIGVCRGQQMDMDFEKARYASEDDYLRMVELKTAVLFAGALKIGAIIGGAGEADADLLYSFGRNLGLAFQIQDDILDAYGDPSVFGKKRGGDIISNKKTILLIKAFELASGEDLKTLHAQLALAEFDPDDKIKAVMSVFDRIGVKKHTERIAFDYVKEAFTSVEKLNIDPLRKEPLLTLAHDMIVRSR